MSSNPPFSRPRGYTHPPWQIVAVACGLVTFSIVACNPRPRAAPSLATITKKLAARMAKDPNGALCSEIAQAFNRGSVEALTPHLDRQALVSRGITLNQVPETRAALWRRDARGIDALSRFHFAKGTRFYCLGTRTIAGDKVLALRLRHADTNFGHLLLRLGGSDPRRPIDDYMLVASGYWHSALQMFFDSPRAKPLAKVHHEMLMGSYANKHQEIITQYQALPRAMQRTPIMASHYINAVMTVTPAGKEETHQRFKDCLPLITEAFQQPMTRAHWRLVFLARLKQVEPALAEARILADAVDDPFVHDLHQWIRSRP